VGPWAMGSQRLRLSMIPYQRTRNWKALRPVPTGRSAPNSVVSEYSRAAGRQPGLLRAQSHHSARPQPPGWARSGAGATAFAQRWNPPLLVDVNEFTLAAVLEHPDLMATLEQIEDFRSLVTNAEQVVTYQAAENGEA